MHDTFYDLSIAKINPDPNAVDDGGALVKSQGSMLSIAFKRVHVEHRLCIPHLDVLLLIGVQPEDAETFGCSLGRIMQEVFDRLSRGSLQISFDRIVSKLDNDLFRRPGVVWLRFAV